MLGSTMASITSSASGSIRDTGAVVPAVRAATRNVTAWPATTSAEASTMPGHACRASRPSRMSPAAAFSKRAQRERPPAGRAAADQHDAGRRHDERERDERHGRLHGRRQHEQNGDGQDGLHDLPGGALPRDGAQAAADVAHVATVADPAVDVAHDAAGQRDVEEQRAVVRRHGRGQRQVDAEAAGHDPPAPGAAHGGQHARGRRGRQRAAVDRADAVEERAGAQAPDQDGERRGGAGEAGPGHTARLIAALDLLAAAPAGRRGPR